MSSARLRLKAMPRQVRLRYSQSENGRYIGNYVAIQQFLRELRVFAFVLVPNPER